MWALCGSSWHIVVQITKYSIWGRVLRPTTDSGCDLRAPQNEKARHNGRSLHPGNFHTNCCNMAPLDQMEHMPSTKRNDWMKAQVVNPSTGLLAHASEQHVAASILAQETAGVQVCKHLLFARADRGNGRGGQQPGSSSLYVSEQAPCNPHPLLRMVISFEPDDHPDPTTFQP